MSRQFSRTSSQRLTRSGTPVTNVPLSMACWFWTANGDNAKDLMCIGSSTDNANYIIRANTNEQIQACTYGGGANGNPLAAGNFSLETWNHACGVWEAEDARVAFLNGAVGFQNTNSVTVPNQDMVGLASYIWHNNFGNYWDGYLAEAAIWNVALSEDEVAVLAAGYSPLFVRPGSLVAYWPLIRDEDQDKVGGYDLTAYNSPTIAAHPPIIYPAQPYIVTAPSGGTQPPIISIPVFMRHFRNLRI